MAKIRIRTTIRDPSPCKGCPERFRACSDNCPIDQRGGYGYKAWHAEIDRVKKNKQDYIDRTKVRCKRHLGGSSYGNN